MTRTLIVRGLTIIGAALVAIAIAFVLLRSVIDPREEVDFRFFWLAGKLWAAGIDPYSAAFEAIGARLLPVGNTVLFWFYPPQWWAICRALAWTDLATATAAWRLASGVIVIGATFWLAATLTSDKALRFGIAALAAGYAGLIEPTANLLAFGQSAAPLLLALVLLTIGFARGSRTALAAGMTLLTLKPQVGGLVLLILLAVPRARVAALAGLAIAVLLCLPQVIGFGPFTTIREYLANLSQWGTLPSNTMLASSGVLHLVARLVPLAILPQAQFLLLLPFAAWSAMLLRRDPEAPLPALFLLTSALTALTPLHIYDMTIIVVPLGLGLVVLPAAWSPILAIVAALCVRPGKIENLLGVPTYSGGVSAGLISLSIAAAMLLALAIAFNAGLLASRKRGEPLAGTA